MADTLTDQTLRILKGFRLGEEVSSQLLHQCQQPRTVLRNALVHFAALVIEEQSRFRPVR